MAHRIRTHTDHEIGRSTRELTIDTSAPFTDEIKAAWREHIAATLAGASFDHVVEEWEVQARAWQPDAEAEIASKSWYAAAIVKSIAHVRSLLRRTPGRATMSFALAEAVAVSAVRVGSLCAEAGAKYDWRIVDHGRKIQKARKAGGKATGAKVASKAAANDKAILRLWRQWQASDELQDTYRSPGAYIRTKLPKLTARTVERRLQKLLKRDSS